MAASTVDPIHPNAVVDLDTDIDPGVAGTVVDSVANVITDAVIDLVANSTVFTNVSGADAALGSIADLITDEIVSEAVIIQYVTVDSDAVAYFDPITVIDYAAAIQRTCCRLGCC